ncbi:K+-transporting ATPase subunit B [Peribacillus simplex]|uniref:K+-transporting ATPase subunit B n=1 Tax=Peribacillus simplex TaxID=1478 RepID=A0AAN2TSU0_9BACI|nr:K+-transporting ATPase subunit B [Peribacillus simplex]
MSIVQIANVNKNMVYEAGIDALKKMNPKVMSRNPVMFVVEVGFAITLLLSIFPALLGGVSDRGYNVAVSIILFVTIIFSNFAEALAEGRGKAQANSLKKTKQDAKARLLQKDGSVMIVDALQLRKGDIVLVKANDIIPADGEIIEGVAAIDESAITGESASVIKEPGGDFSSVTGGTKVISDFIKVKVGADPGESFLDRMINLVEGAKRQKTPNEIALGTLLISLTIIFILVCTTLVPIASYIQVTLPTATLVALLVCLIPTTIGGLLSAIGIAGMDRVTQFNVIAKSGKSVEAAGDINTIILDNTW